MKHSWLSLLLILIASVLLLIGLERAFSPLFQNCIEEHQHREGGNSAEKQPSGFSVTASAYVQCTGRFVNAIGNSITALATIIIAAFTGTLWIATSRQAQLTEETLIADKRAFIFADNYMQFWELDATTNLHNWRFRPHWRNTGSTPTRRLTMHVECEVRNTMLPEGYAFTYDRTQIGKGIIPPKGEMLGGIAPQAAAITPQDILDSQAGRKFIYLWGWAKYVDVFPGTPEHITHFCWLITVTGVPTTFVPNTPGQPPTFGTLAFNYIQHTEGNYTDET